MAPTQAAHRIAAEPRARVRGGFAWSVLAVSGIAFWFVLGFPFAHQNESYGWALWIDTPDLRSVAFYHFHGTGGYRPLAMTIAWLLYRIGGGSLVPIQLFNFACTVAAWQVMARAMDARRSFALVALVVGGVLFSGYIYLFHLHGVFYGLLLFWLACAVRGSMKPTTPRGLAAVALGGFVASTAHPYALVFALAFMGGLLIEMGWLKDPKKLGFALVAGVAGAWLILDAMPTNFLVSAFDAGARAVLSSFRATEVNAAVSAVAALLALATVATTRWRGRVIAVAAVALVGLAALVLVRLGLPILLLWIAAALVKACLHQRFALGLMLAVSLGLPFAGGAGSPTYLVFAVALATVVLALDIDPVERVLVALRPGHALAVTSALLVLAGLVRAGVRVPVVDSLTRPVLAERERTQQLDRLLRELLASPWRTRPERFVAIAAAPIQSGGAPDRRRRPPTQQIFLDAYVRHVRGTPDAGLPPVYLSFGEGPVPGTPVLTVPGRYAGPAVASVVPDSGEGVSRAASKLSSPPPRPAADRGPRAGTGPCAPAPSPRRCPSGHARPGARRNARTGRWHSSTTGR